MSLLCRVWPAILEILGPTVPPDRKWVTNEPLLFLLQRLSVKWCQAAVQSFGTAARAAVHKPIRRDKWDLILQVLCIISVGNEAPTSALIKLNIAGSSVPGAVMWWAGGMLTQSVCWLTQLNFYLKTVFQYLHMYLMYLSSSFRVNLENLDLAEQLWVALLNCRSKDQLMCCVLQIVYITLCHTLYVSF